MRQCMTLALILSLSACEHASEAIEPVPPAHTPPAKQKPALSAKPAVTTEAKKPLPKQPCRTRACPAWKAPATEVPVDNRRPGVSRASPWQGAAPKVRVKKLPEATK